LAITHIFGCSFRVSLFHRDGAYNQSMKDIKPEVGMLVRPWSGSDWWERDCLGLVIKCVGIRCVVQLPSCTVTIPRAKLEVVSASR